MYEGWKGVAALITGALVFLGSWAYCIAEYGYLWGVGLGWLPSLIVGSLAASLWFVIWGGIAIVLWLVLIDS